MLYSVVRMLKQESLDKCFNKKKLNVNYVYMPDLTLPSSDSSICDVFVLIG